MKKLEIPEKIKKYEKYATKKNLLFTIAGVGAVTLTAIGIKRYKKSGDEEMSLPIQGRGSFYAGKDLEFTTPEGIFTINQGEELKILSYDVEESSFVVDIDGQSVHIPKKDVCYEFVSTDIDSSSTSQDE